VLERGYLAGGNTARNTTTIRSNYITPASIRFYAASLKLFESLPEELDFNLMFSQRGQLTLAHSTGAVRMFRQRVETGKSLGIRVELVGVDEVARLCPCVNLDAGGRYAVMAGLWHADGATARHDAVAWAYAARAGALGVEIHQRTTVEGFEVAGGRVVAVRTSRGRVEAGAVVQAAGGQNGEMAALAGLSAPIRPYPLQAMVTQPLKPFLDPLVSSADRHVYAVQMSRGEIVIGGGADPYPLAATRSTCEQKEKLAVGIIGLFPFLAKVRVMRQWAGITDITPDFSPIMGATPLANYWLDVGWGTWGFKATPAAGRYIAQTVASSRAPDIIAPFRLERFSTLGLINEVGATAASH
jgi:sarcosine oxidase subunit beta